MVHDGQALVAIDMARADMDDSYLINVVELFEIVHRAVPLLYDQVSDPSKFAERVGLSDSRYREDILVTALHFDSCLSKWEHNLPPPLRLGVNVSAEDEFDQRQAIILRIRYIHVVEKALDSLLIFEAELRISVLSCSDLY